MGRTILCNECHSTFDEDILKKKNSENKCLVCGASLVGGNVDSDHMESPDIDSGKEGWVTWYYYGMKDNKGRKTKTTCLDDKPIDLKEHGDTFFLIQEFKAPPESECGLDKVKEILRTYVPDAFVYPEKKEPVVRCPRCMSREYTLMHRGYSLFTGFLGSGRVKRVCNYCKKEF